MRISYFTIFLPQSFKLDSQISVGSTILQYYSAHTQVEIGEGSVPTRNRFRFQIRKNMNGNGLSVGQITLTKRQPTALTEIISPHHERSYHFLAKRRIILEYARVHQTTRGLACRKGFCSDSPRARTSNSFVPPHREIHLPMDTREDGRRKRSC